jgi:hypothetical protein
MASTSDGWPKFIKTFHEWRERKPQEGWGTRNFFGSWMDQARGASTSRRSQAGLGGDVGQRSWTVLSTTRMYQWSGLWLCSVGCPSQGVISPRFQHTGICNEAACRSTDVARTGVTGTGHGVPRGHHTSQSGAPRRHHEK